MRLEEQVKKEVEKLKKRKYTKAVAIVGSYARNPEQEHNDIDIYIIVDENWRKRVTTEKENGVVFEYFYNSQEWAESYFEDRDHIWYMYHWMKNADVKYDPENIFQKLEEKADEWKDRKLDLSKQQKNRIRYGIWDFQQDLEKVEDIGQKRFIMNKFFDYLLDKNYLINQEPLVKDNYKLERLKQFDGYMYKLAQEFLTNSSTMKKQRKLEKMIDHITRKIGDPQPDWKTEREKFN